MARRKQIIFSELASLDGLGVVTEAIVDYSAAQVSYQLLCPVDELYEVNRVIVGIGDTAINNSGEYGSITALTNGVVIRITDTDGGSIQLLTPFAITTNGDYSRLSYDTLYNSLGNGNDYLTVRWTFAKHGAPIVLEPGQYIEIELNDNFTGLANQTFLFQGVRTYFE